MKSVLDEPWAYYREQQLEGLPEKVIEEFRKAFYAGAAALGAAIQLSGEVGVHQAGAELTRYAESRRKRA